MEISYLMEKEIYTGEMLFKTISPILLEKGSKTITYRDKDFEEELNYYTDKLLRLFTGKGLKQPLKFTPVKMRKDIVYHTLKDYRKNKKQPLIKLNTSSGTFKLKGNPQDLYAIYKMGIGNRRGQGFGMIDVS